MFTRLFAFVTCAAVVYALALPARAGTTGSIVGRVVTSSGAPIAGAKISAFSSTQVLDTASDAAGDYRFASLAPDAYTLTVVKPGFVSLAQDTVVFADQTSSVTLQLLANTTNSTAVQHQSGRVLVKPGVASNVYSISANDTLRLGALSGSGNFDHAYSAMQTVPGIFIAPGQVGWYQIMSIRGGDQDQIGYEFDGVPVVRRFDNAPIPMLSDLGQQELQVYTGGIPATSDATSISGYVNQVVTQGRAPNFASSTVGIGAPAFYHKAQLELGGAAGAFTYYVGMSGINQSFNYFDQNNGAPSSGYFYPVNVPLGPAGIYVGGPTTFASGSTFGIAAMEERENIANFHFAIPRKRGLNDDVQLLFADSTEFSSFYSSLADLGGACVANGCTPYTWQDTQVYSGPMFAPFKASGVQTYNFPSSPSHTFGGAMPAGIRDGTYNDSSILKLQYQHNFSNSSYLRLFGYSVYSDWFLNGASSSNQQFGFELADWEPVTHTAGLVADAVLPFGRNHSLSLSASYEKTHALWNSNQTGFPVTSNALPITSLVDPSTGFCYDYTNPTQQWSCFDSTKQGTIQSPTPAGPALPANEQWLVTENGYAEALSNNYTQFTSAAISDEWRPSDRWVINIGARAENFAFLFGDTAPNDRARQFWFNAYNREYCFGPGQSMPVQRLADPVTGAPGLGACPANTFALGTNGNPLLVNQSGGSTSTTVVQPRIAFAYTAGKDDVFRGSWGVYARPPYANWMQYNTQQEDLASFIGSSFYAYGFNTPEHNLRPDKSFNMDISWEHAFGKTGYEFKVSPFLRSTQNQEQIFEINPLTALESGLNVGHQTTSGIELLLTKGNPADQGLTWALSYTHLHSRIRYSNFAGTNSNVIDIINRSILQYNAYTQTCAASPSDPRCAGTTSTGVAAAACYTAAGAPDGSCAAGDVANPYFTSAPQQLLARNGSYVPYDIFPGPYIGANGFETPDFGSLVVNYRHGRWNFTPSLVFNSGASYGSPLVWPGYDPLTCAPISAANPAANTPTCTGSIFIPDQYTGGFDTLGSLRQPWRLTGNLQVGYQLNPRITARLRLANVFDICGQRGYAWDSPGVCVYSQLPSNILAPVGNFMSPNAAPPQLRYPYGVWNNNLNLAYIGARLPLQVSLEIQVKL